MKNAKRVVTGLLATSSICVTVRSASAGTYFFDDFESQPVTSPGTKMQNPPIGLSYSYNPATAVSAVNVVTAPLPVIGTKSLEEFRSGSLGPDVSAISLDHALLDGKTIQVGWIHTLAN